MLTCHVFAKKSIDVNVLTTGAQKTENVKMQCVEKTENVKIYYAHKTEMQILNTHKKLKI